MARWNCLVAAALALAAAWSAASTCSAASAAVRAPGRRVSVGAIRWDAWNQPGGNYDNVSRCARAALSPEQFQWRLPFFATVQGNDTVAFNGDSAAVMEQELRAARHAGLDFFAFDTYCAYPSNASVPECQQYLQDNKGYAPVDPAYGLRRFLSAPPEQRGGMTFALLLLGSPAAAPAFLQDTVAHLKRPEYYRVTDASGASRPLVLLFQASDNAAKFVGGWPAWKQRWQRLRQASIAAGAGNPYLVAMDFTVERASTLSSNLGFDAISTYALPQSSGKPSEPFSDQLASAEAFWQGAAAAGAKVLAQAPTGWDARPRALHEPPWVDEGPNHYDAPTPAELQQMVSSAVNFTCANLDGVAESGTVLMYAWNENSEGGMLIPTLGNGTTRVDALSGVLPANPCS